MERRAVTEGMEKPEMPEKADRRNWRGEASQQERRGEGIRGLVWQDRDGRGVDDRGEVR